MEKIYTVSKNKIGSWLWLRTCTTYYKRNSIWHPAVQHPNKISKSMLAWGNLKFYKFNWEKYVHWQTSLGFPLLKLKGSKSELHDIMILVHIPLCRYEHIYSEILTAKFRLKLKKVGKTTKPFRYDRNQIPCYYTVEVTNRFKAFDLIGRVPEELWMRFATLYRRQGSRPSPRKRNVKRQNGSLRRPNK